MAAATSAARVGPLNRASVAVVLAEIPSLPVFPADRHGEQWLRGAARILRWLGEHPGSGGSSGGTRDHPAHDLDPPLEPPGDVLAVRGERQLAARAHPLAVRQVPHPAVVFRQVTVVPPARPRARTSPPGAARAATVTAAGGRPAGRVLAGPARRRRAGRLPRVAVPARRPR